jgi:aspartate kinase
MPRKWGQESVILPDSNALTDTATVNLTDSIRVLKFGGTSVGSGERILDAATLVLETGGTPVVVVSAMSGVTNDLASLAAGDDTLLEPLLRRHLEAARVIHPSGPRQVRLEEALRERIARLAHQAGDVDEIMAAGEDLSVLLMTAALERLSGEGDPPRARGVDARTLVRTDPGRGGGIPRDDETVELARRHLLPLVAEGTIPVTQGFVGATADGRTTTLGRGGSDFTAAIIGAALGAPEVTIWTDVDGIFSADPNRVPGARVLPELGYEEAVELAWFGARVIHPAAAKHALGRRVALRIRNTLNPEHPGTLIRIDRRSTPGVAALAYKPHTALITVRSRPHFMAHGFLARVFEVLSGRGVPVDLVATSHTSTAFTVDESADLDEVRAALNRFAEVEVRAGLATVSAIGQGLLRMPGILAEVFRVLEDLPIHLVSQATDTSLSLVVDEGQGETVVRRLHDALLPPSPSEEPVP